MNKDIQRKQVLPDSKMPVAKGAKDDEGNKIKPAPVKRYDAEGEIKKFGVAATEVVEYKDVFTGQLKKIIIDRRGTTDEKLALALLDDKVSRDQKDSMLSMYLFEKGKQGSSMLMDLWMYKGAHTKESRAFQSTMRFDFELFLQVFQTFMQDSADLVFKNLPIKVTMINTATDHPEEIISVTRDVSANEIAVVLGRFAQYHRMTSDLLGKRIRAEVEKRERSRGKGIYIGMDNKPYSVHEDGDIVEIVAKDKAEADKEKNHE